MTNLGTGIGSMPGEDFAESMRIVLGEVGEFPYLPELPARGATASMTGRTLAMVDELGADLQPAGWRLTDAAGIDHRRAKSLLGQDLDTLEELAQGHRGRFKVQLAGPWTLAATVERPRGDKVLADHGARRDLAQALAEGLRAHMQDVRRRVGGAEIVVQIDEPLLPAVLAGSVPTASGFHRHRSVTPPEAAASLGWVVDVITEADARAVAHCCAAGLPLAVLTRTAVAGVSFDVGLVSDSEYDDLGGWVAGGRELWLGVVPSTDPGGPPPTEADLTRRVLRWWSTLGYSEVESIPPTIVTPTCGLAGASPGWARRALTLSQQVARNLSVEQGRIEP